MRVVFVSPLCISSISIFSSVRLPSRLRLQAIFSTDQLRKLQRAVRGPWGGQTSRYKSTFLHTWPASAQTDARRQTHSRHKHRRTLGWAGQGFLTKILCGDNMPSNLITAAWHPSLCRPVKGHKGQEHHMTISTSFTRKSASSGQLVRVHVMLFWGDIGFPGWTERLQLFDKKKSQTPNSYYYLTPKNTDADKKQNKTK